MNKLEKIENFFSKDTGFDTPKKLNRSEKKITQELLENIETVGITSEQLETLGLPVFKYHTQITVHGLFPEIGYGRIGNYKCLVRNQNESLGIKYLAVDKEKKQRIFSVLRNYGFHTYKNSTNWDAYQMSNHLPTKEDAAAKVAEYKALAASIPMELICGSINIGLFRHPLLGTIHAQMIVSINAVKEVNMWQFIERTTGKTREEIEIHEAELKAIAEKERAEQELKWKAQSEARKAKESEVIALLVSSGYALRKVDHEGIYVKVDYDGDMKCYKVFLPKGKKVFRYFEKKVTNFPELPTFEETYLHEKKEFLPRSMYCKEIPALPAKEEKKVATIKANEPMEPVSIADVRIIDYSEKAIAVYGNTKPIKEQLKSIGARFNMFLTIEGIKQPGWVLPISQRSKLNFIQSN